MIVSKKNLRIIIFCTFLMIGLIKCSFFSNTVYRVYSCVILGTLFVLTSLNSGRMKRNIWAILLGSIISFSVLRSYSGLGRFFLAITYFFQYVTPFYVCDYLTKKYGIKKMVMGLFWASVFITVIMDVSVIVGLDVDETHYQNLVSYFFGNKFMVGYLHMQTMGIYALYLYLKEGYIGKKHKIKLLLLGICAILLCIKVECSTGIVGNFIITALIILPLNKHILDLLSSRKFIFLFILIANIALVASEVLVNIPAIKYIIESVLHENINLTGRYTIYAMLPGLFREQLLFGYGYNRDIFADLIGYGNAQNGILQYMIDCGLVGTVLFVINWINSMKGIRSRSEITWPLVAAVYAFSICGLVEVCLKLNFIVILAMLYCMRMLDETCQNA